MAATAAIHALAHTNAGGQQALETPMADAIVNDWNQITDSEDGISSVTNTLFIQCKTVVEDGQGGLFLNATIVQRVFAAGGDRASLSDTAKLIGELRLKAWKGELTGQRVEERTLDSIHLCSRTLDLSGAELIVRHRWNW